MILQRPINLFIQGNTGRHTHNNYEILLSRHCEQPPRRSTVRVGVCLDRPWFCSLGATPLSMFPISPNLPSGSFFFPRNLHGHIQGAWGVTSLGDTKLSLPHSSWCYSQVSEGYIILFCFSQRILTKLLFVRPCALGTVVQQHRESRLFFSCILPFSEKGPCFHVTYILMKGCFTVQTIQTFFSPGSQFFWQCNSFRNLGHSRHYIVLILNIDLKSVFCLCPSPQSFSLAKGNYFEAMWNNRLRWKDDKASCRIYRFNVITI